MRVLQVDRDEDLAHIPQFNFLLVDNSGQLSKVIGAESIHVLQLREEEGIESKGADRFRFSFTFVD